MGERVENWGWAEREGVWCRGVGVRCRGVGVFVVWEEPDVGSMIIDV